MPQRSAGAAFTTDNPNAGDVCLHGPSGDSLAVNCNIYESKTDVWINGGPSAGQNHLTDGEYFFAVMVPGGQPDPNDNGDKNLSDVSSVGGIEDECGSAYTDRTFTVSDGKIDAFTGAGADCPYATDSTYDPPMGLLVNLFPYDTTSNPGGVYILAICSLEGGYPVSPRDCKYDAFKVRSGDPENPPAAALSVTKTATESFDRTYDWDIDKSADKTSVQTTANNVTVNYTVLVSHDGGTDSGWAVDGSITVFNPNVFAVEVDVTDAINDPTATCTVPTGTDALIAAESSEEFAYSCTYSAAPAAGNVQHGNRRLGPRRELSQPAPTASLVAIDFSGVTPDEIDECINITDDFDGGGPVSLGSRCVGDAGHVIGDPTAWEIKYSRVISVPRNACVTKNNTAAFVSTDGGDSGSDNWSVTLCGPITNGFTLGFWSNKNGEAVLCGNDPAWRNLLNSLNLKNKTGGPFSDQPRPELQDRLRAVPNLAARR